MRNKNQCRRGVRRLLVIAKGTKYRLGKLCMKREDRAKQFLPFDAMKGLGEAMRRQEELAERRERIEQGEEDAAEVSAVLSRLSRGDRVNVTFFREGQYLTRSGVVTVFDEVKRMLRVGEEWIAFDDLFAIEITAFRS